MKSFELKPTFENLKDTFLNDSIGRSADVCAFAKLLLNIEGSLSLGVDGKWGTGKTFFVRQTQMVLDSLNPNIPPYSMNGMEKIRDSFKKITKLELQSIPPIVESLPWITFLLTETARIKQNRAENAKPSQFSLVFLEVLGGLRRDKGIQQALTKR